MLLSRNVLASVLDIENRAPPRLLYASVRLLFEKLFVHLALLVLHG